MACLYHDQFFRGQNPQHKDISSPIQDTFPISSYEQPMVLHVETLGYIFLYSNATCQGAENPHMCWRRIY